MLRPFQEDGVGAQWRAKSALNVAGSTVETGTKWLGGGAVSDLPCNVRREGG